MTRTRSPETPEQKRKRRARENARKKRKRDAKRAERLAANPARGSKTSAAYRQIRFGIVPEMTKSELRAVLTQAVINTAAMGVAQC